MDNMEKHSVVEITNGQDTRYAVANADGLFLQDNLGLYTHRLDSAMRLEHAETAFAIAAHMDKKPPHWTVVRVL